MKITIGKRLGLGFGSLIFLTLVIFILTFFTVNENKENSEEIANIYTPSVLSLEKMYVITVKSKLLIQSWLHNPKIDHPDKERMRELIDHELPEVKAEVKALSEHWDRENQLEIDTVFQLLDSLEGFHKHVMSELSTFDNYEDALVLFLMRTLVEDEEIDVLTREILIRLEDVINAQQQNTNLATGESLKSNDILQKIVVFSGILLVLGGLVIGLLTTRSIVGPVKKLRLMLLSMGKGVIPEERIDPRNDEIGEMSNALNDMIDGLKRTIDFSYQVGTGNFDVHYEPLSDKDTLGHTLLKMRDELAESERILEEKVRQRTEEVVLQKQEIEEKNEKLEILYKHVTDSIRYAKRIQQAILPPDDMVKELLPESFVLYRPKDIVSGDYYWVQERKDQVLFAAVDCTGHGVPGAFMSIVGHNLLNHITENRELVDPAEIMNELNKGVTETLRQTYEESSTKDGMDMALVALDKKAKKLKFAGAFNPIYIIPEDGNDQRELPPNAREFSKGDPGFEIKGNKFPVGIFIEEEMKQFTCHEVNLKKGDMIYIFSDGFVDQFGGTKGKKFMATRFRQVLVENRKLPAKDQLKVLSRVLDEWMGEEEQVDDILVMGVRVV